MNKYKTQSLALAAALTCVSTAKLTLIDFNSTSQRATFYFNRDLDSNFDDIITRFWTKQLPIDSSTYFEAIKHIKNRLYSEKRSYAE
jgi:hypothetical protein